MSLTTTFKNVAAAGQLALGELVTPNLQKAGLAGAAALAATAPSQAAITLVDYTIDPALAGSPAIESSSNGSEASNIFGTSGGVNFLTLDLTGYSGDVTLSELSLLVSSKKYQSSGESSITSTTALLQNSKFLIGVVPYVATVGDVQATLSASPIAFDLSVGVNVSQTGLTTALNTGTYDVMKITTSSQTFSGLSITGGQKYSVIFQETGFFNESGETYSNGPLTLTVNHLGSSDSIFSGYESGSSVYEVDFPDRNFAYGAKISIPEASSAILALGGLSLALARRRR